ncbi:uncharacterized protein LOC143624935 [Bidens hawaiensis]|uniref:uncharacterized protein LOC143624935 n=1 Tax=Bidens hawaiensis TaxID=980011 RepID=UPI004049B7F1
MSDDSSSDVNTETLIAKLDISNPLYLHASNSNTLTANAMKLALQVKNTIGFVTGTCERPTDDEFLMGVDDFYQPVRTNLLTREPLPSIKTAFSIVSWEESHRNSKASSKTQSSNVGFVSKATQFIDNKKKFYQPFCGPNPNLKCTRCNKIGHTVENSTARSLTPYQVSKLLGLLNDKTGEGQLSANVGDSGANQHMVMSDKDIFNSIDEFDFNISVKHQNGSNAAVTKIGSLKLDDKVILTDVFVVPYYYVNLLSVYKLASDNKLSMTFNENNCYIQDSLSKRTLVTGRQVNGLYLCGVSSNLVKVCFTSFDQVNLWHSRLRHPASRVLSVLKDDLNVKVINDSLPCDVCRKAKQHREPFPLSDHVSLKIGELVHLDVWGPYTVKSREGFRYFLTIVDDSLWLFGDNDNQNVFDKSPNDEGGSVSNDSLADQPPSSSSSTNRRADDKKPINTEESTSEVGPTCSNGETNPSKGTTQNDPSPPITVRRSTRSSSLPIKLDDFIVEGKVKYGLEKVLNYSNLSKENFCLVSILNKSFEPKHYRDAINDNSWIVAMNEEMSALHRNNTCELVDLPSDRKPIGCKWVYKIKYKSSGEIERYKARLVAKGFIQREAVDFD